MQIYATIRGNNRSRNLGKKIKAISTEKSATAEKEDITMIAISNLFIFTFLNFQLR
jgi:hypothetical protein